MSSEGDTPVSNPCSSPTQSSAQQIYVPIGKKDVEPSFLSSFYYKRLLKCKYCFAKFKGLQQLEYHFKSKHQDKKQFAYESIVVNGKYIQQQLANCHTHKVSFICENDACGEIHETLNSCCLRLCEKCYSVRRNRQIKKNKLYISNYKRRVFLTLTQKSHLPLNKEIIDNLNYSWKKFYKQLNYNFPYRYSYVKVLEIIPKDDGYYYHLHLVVDMPYVPQRILSLMWRKATENNSYVVNIQQIKQTPGRNSIESALLYVSKYLAKPIKSNQDTKQFAELYSRFLYARHFSHNFTSLDYCSVLEHKNPLICDKCGCVMRFNGVESIQNEIPPPIVDLNAF